MSSIRVYVAVGTLVAAWVVLGAWILTDVAGVKRSIDTVAAQRAPPETPEVLHVASNKPRSASHP